MPKNNPFPPGSLVSFYSRDSGGDEQDLSIQRQIGEFKRWCAENELIPGEIFADEARPGSTVVGRADFLRMVKHFRSGQAREQGLVVWRFSRFGRNASERKYYKADIRRLGYIIYSMSDQIPDDRFGKLIEDVLDWKDEYFLEELSEEVSSGLRNIVKQYGAVPGTPPRGFMRQEVKVSERRDGSPHILHRWIPDPSMVDLVQRAFSMLAQGKTLREIQVATGLYSSSNSYSTFFRNPIYKGVLHYKDLVIEEYCEPIVDPSLWERVQLILDARAGRGGHITSTENPSLHPRRIASTWLLSGIARCAKCNSPLNGHIIKEWTYYACSRAIRRHDCDAVKIPSTQLEKSVTNAIREYLSNPNVLEALQSERMKEYSQATEQFPKRYAEIENRLVTIRRQITNLASAIAEHGHSKVLLKSLTELEVQEYEVKNELDKLNQVLKTKPVEITPQRIASMKERFERIMSTGSDDEKRQLIAGWIHTLQAERDGKMIRAQVEIYIPPTGPDPPRGKITKSSKNTDKEIVVFHSLPPWGHKIKSPQGGFCFLRPASPFRGCYSNPREGKIK